MRNQKGLGLPEILIALVLASLTTMALMRHYLNTKRQYSHIQTALERNIEMQLVADLIRDSARRAGFTPCLGIDHLITVDQRNEHNKLVAIEIDPNGEHSLQMNRMSEHFDTVLKVSNSIALLTTHNQTLHPDGSILIADCYHAEVQKIKQIKQTSAGQIITVTQPLAFTYHAPVYIGAWIEELYSIRSQNKHKSTLYYQHQHAEELTTAIHTLSARLDKHLGRTLLQVVLGMDNRHQLELETMVRTR